MREQHFSIYFHAHLGAVCYSLFPFPVVSVCVCVCMCVCRCVCVCVWFCMDDDERGRLNVHAIHHGFMCIHCCSSTFLLIFIAMTPFKPQPRHRRPASPSVCFWWVPLKRRLFVESCSVEREG